MARDKAIVLSTHILEEVDAVCTRAMIIAQGRIVADCTPHELEARSRYHNAVSLRAQSAAHGERQAPALEKLPNVAAVEELEGEDNMVCLIAFPRDGKPIIARHQPVQPRRRSRQSRRCASNAAGSTRCSAPITTRGQREAS